MILDQETPASWGRRDDEVKIYLTIEGRHIQIVLYDKDFNTFKHRYLRDPEGHSFVRVNNPAAQGRTRESTGD